MKRTQSTPVAGTDPAELDSAEIARQVDAVLAEPLYWFGVRHHSPTVARHLASALASRRPKLIFIEGPYEANEIVRYVVDAKTEPPVAIYSSYRDDDNVLASTFVERQSVAAPPKP